MTPAELVRGLEPGTLEPWVSTQRWFAAKARDLARVEVVDAVTLSDTEPVLVVAIVEAVFAAGTHEHYHLPLLLRPAGTAPPEETIAVVDGTAISDAVTDPAAGLALGQLVLQGRVGEEATTGSISFHHHGVAELPLVEEVHAFAAEQSNSSIVYDGSVIMKCYRRVEAGPSPELELLHFLSRHDFAHVPELLGWFDYRGEVFETTLGIAQRFIRHGRDGWEHVVDGLLGDPDALLPDLAAFGRMVGALHTTLGSDLADPDFGREQKASGMLDLVIATIEEEIRTLFTALPEGDERFAGIIGRGSDLAALLRSNQQFDQMGAVIRVHGDLHLGQALLTEEREWILLDFEGEPARSLRVRRRKRSPLRDVAALLRSVSYAVATARSRGADVPDSWEPAARAAILDAYFETVDRSLLPNGERATATLLSIFELEKAIYELRYEMNNRPDWVPIPIAGIIRILETEPA